MLVLGVIVCAICVGMFWIFKNSDSVEEKSGIWEQINGYRGYVREISEEEYEFYEYLVNNVKNGSALLDKMKAKITEDTVLWSDMESGLGEFTIATNNAEEFDDFYFELSEHLQNYLKSEDEKFTPSEKLKNKDDE